MNEPSPESEASASTNLDAQHPYIGDKRMSALEEAYVARSCGFAVLYDIIDSTLRKHTQRHWQLHTECLYEAFANFCKEVAKHFNCDTHVVKFIGDGLLGFFPVGTGSNQRCIGADDFVERIMNFRSVMEDSLGAKHGNLRLKCVGAFLSDVAVLGADGARDVLGREVDFLFRLERYAGPAYVILNDELANATDRFRDPESVWKLRTCNRNIKGWEREGPRTFSLLVSPEDVGNSHPRGGLNDDHVTAELLEVVLEWKSQQDVSQVLPPEWTSKNEEL